MHLVFLNGNEFRGGFRDFLRALWHPLFVSLVLGMVSIILILRPYDQFMPDDVMARTMIMASSILVFLTSALLLVTQSKRWPILTFTLPILCVSVFFASLTGVVTSVAAGGQALGFVDWVRLLGFNITLATLAEVFLATFLLERIALETGMKALPIMAFAPMQEAEDIGEAPRSHDTAERWVDLLGERLPAHSILHLKAEEHYVSVMLEDGRTLLLRGRLADAIGQLPPDSGMQIHRSHWVAKAAVSNVFRAREGWRLRLTSGQDVPVARNRTMPVRAWANGVLQSA